VVVVDPGDGRARMPAGPISAKPHSGLVAEGRTIRRTTVEAQGSAQIRRAVAGGEKVVQPAARAATRQERRHHHHLYLPEGASVTAGRAAPL